jgi:hypothetical protein
MGEYRRIIGPTSSPFEYPSWEMFLDKHCLPEILAGKMDMEDDDLDWWWLDLGGLSFPITNDTLVGAADA